jgi:hypothetical protein
MKFLSFAIASAGAGILIGLALGIEILKIRRRRHDRLRYLDVSKPERFWSRIFSQSRVNGGPYRGGELPTAIWKWPRGTFLERSLNRHGTEKKENGDET